VALQGNTLLLYHKNDRKRAFSELSFLTPPIPYKARTTSIRMLHVLLLSEAGTPSELL